MKLEEYNVNNIQFGTWMACQWPTQERQSVQGEFADCGPCPARWRAARWVGPL